MSYEDINEYLGNKNWQFISIKEDGVYNVITWAYGKDYNDKAAAWFYLSVSNYDFLIPNSVSYQTGSVKTINIIKSKMKELGFKQKSSYVNETEIVTQYFNAKYDITLASHPETNEDPSKYIIHVFKKNSPPKATGAPTPSKKPKTNSITLDQFFKNVQDSIEAAQREADSLAAIEAIMETREMELTSTRTPVILRSKPTLQSTSLAEIPANTVVEIIDEKNGDYCFIRYIHQDGYVLKSSLKKYAY